ncbi:hypothetical protein C9374_010173 [Naegleria lovaniensis]|uniref:F-box domain-containing protein n=1 Tax=Naegleria lovaniensis TaxID=51637 RepID=A0AA88KGA4_NAELO|nr:uncharacterized protein C9374_010173 [Naegleria lovaniensis]KAG2375169.1 hypothetical protein C9374_010173 [Naegleria lovaniensis]
MFHNDILYHIFSFSLLPLVQFRYSLVCKQWYELAHNETFIRNYCAETEKGLNELLNPTHGDLMKYIFDWSEFICHTFPEEYEWMRKLKRSMEIRNLTEIDMTQILSKCSPQISQLIQDSSKLITLDNGAGRQVSLFTVFKQPFSTFTLQALINENGQMLSVNEFDKASSVKTCDMRYNFYYYGWGDGEDVSSTGVEWFCDQFSHLNASVGHSLLFIIFEFITKFVPERNIYLCDLDESTNIVKRIMKDKSYVIRKKARSFKDSLLKREECLSAAFRNCKIGSLWYRLMNCGYTMTSSQFESCFVNHILASPNHLQFFFNYCEFHHMRLFAETQILTRFLYILEKREPIELCRVIKENSYPFPKEICCDLVCIGNEPHYYLLDLIKGDRSDFSCPFDLRATLSQSNTAVSPTDQKIVALYQTYSDQKKFANYFFTYSHNFKSTSIEHRILPHKLTKRRKIKEQFRPCLENYDVILLCAYEINDNKIANLYKNILDELKLSRKRVMFIYQNDYIPYYNFHNLFKTVADLHNVYMMHARSNSSVHNFKPLHNWLTNP